MTPTDSPTPVPTEEHPLQPFLPPHARLLMLGSFPPQKIRWCMDFYYPNFINDMWRIMGYIFHGDRNWFVDERAKCFKKAMIVEFLLDKGIALYDTLPPSAVFRIMRRTSFWKSSPRPTFPGCSDKSPIARPSSPPDKKLPTRCAIPSIYRSPPSVASARS